MRRKRNVQVVSNEKFTGIKYTEPASYAAGFSAVKVSLDHLSKETGTLRGIKILSKMNQKDGFDCPGCAWPDPDDKRSVLGEYCENGAKALAEEATLKKVGPSFFKLHSIEELSQWSDFQLGKSGRLTEPMILKPDAVHYEAISWSEAFDKIGESLKKLDHPDEAIFYTSGRSSNEAAFLWGLFARAFGTNNLPDCSNMCHESSGVALAETLGIGKGSVKLDDLYKAEVVMIIGQNPGTNHPRMLSALQKCKEAGGKIISINPLEEAGLKKFKNPQRIKDSLTGGTALTDVFLQVKINEDIALIKAINKVLLEKHAEGNAFINETFISDKTHGFEQLKADLQNHNSLRLIEQAGIRIEDFNAAIALLAPAKKIIICWAMGLTQHKNAVENIRECVNLLLLKGSIGIPGGGTCPVRGHSNVQGDRSVGIMHHPSEALNKSIAQNFGFTPPTKHGSDTVHAIKDMHEGRAKVFIALGGNFAAAASDSYYTAEALEKCSLTVNISTKLNRTHLIAGETSIILPTLGRSEKDIHNGSNRKLSVENSMGKVHSTRGALEPASSNLMSEPEIIGRIAEATLGAAHVVPWKALSCDYESIRNKIAATIKGFENYNDRIADNKEFYLPNNARIADFSKLENGTAKFTINQVSNHQLEADEFLLMTVRSHDQFNTTIYGLDDRYRGVHNERRVIFMNAVDMKKNDVEEGSVVNITSTYDSVVRRANNFIIKSYDIPQQNLAAYFPETNVLIPIDQYADRSNTPISKSIRVRIEKVQ